MELPASYGYTTVRTLVETGALGGAPGAYRLAQSLPSIQVPATVQAVLAARIDRLSSEDKHLLQTAAVIGTEVSFPLLQAIAEVPEEGLPRGLDHLQAAELLDETRLFPEREFTFKHALTHEVAYGGLLQERQRVLHARIVKALEVLYPDRLAEQVDHLAHHAVRGEVWAKALAYCRQAGVRAEARSAHREAVTYFEQALAALAQLPESRAATEQAIDLQFGFYYARNALGATPAQLLDHLHRAESLAQTPGDQQRLGLVYASMAGNFRVRGDVDRTIDYGQRVLTLAATLGHVGLQARAYLVLGQAYCDAGDYAQAVERLKQNVAMLHGELRYERFGSSYLVAATSRTTLSYCYAELGLFPEGLAMAEEGLRIAETVTNPFHLIDAYHGFSVVYRRQGDVQRAILVLERAMGLCQDGHLPVWRPWVAAPLGVVYVLAGRVTTGLALVEHEVEQAHSMGRLRPLAFLVACLSEAYLMAGRLGEARQRAAQALDLAHQYQQRGNQAWALGLLGKSTARQASPAVESAETPYQRTLAPAEVLGMRPLQAHCHRGLGTLYATLGQREQASIALSTATEMYQNMEMTFWLPQTDGLPQTEAALAQMEGR